MAVCDTNCLRLRDDEDEDEDEEESLLGREQALEVEMKRGCCACAFARLRRGAKSELNDGFTNIIGSLGRRLLPIAILAFVLSQ